MTLRLWLEFKGRLLWGVAALALLGTVSFYWEVARGVRVAATWLTLAGWPGGVLCVLALLWVFFSVGALGLTVFDRTVSVAGSWRSGVRCFVRLGSGGLWFWGVVSFVCVTSLLDRVFRGLLQSADRLGMEGLDRRWVPWVALFCVVFLSYVGLSRLRGRVLRGFDLARPSQHGAGGR